VLGASSLESDGRDTTEAYARLRRGESHKDVIEITLVSRKVNPARYGEDRVEGAAMGTAG